MADRFHSLMTETLSYDKYGVGACDYGALVGAQLGHEYDDSLYGIHLGQEMPIAMGQGDRYWDLTGGVTTEGASPELRADVLGFNEAYVSHFAVHMLDGQTLVHGLNDSPIGLLAWILKRWKTWSDRYGRQPLPLDALPRPATAHPGSGRLHPCASATGPRSTAVTRLRSVSRHSRQVVDAFTPTSAL